MEEENGNNENSEMELWRVGPKGEYVDDSNASREFIPGKCHRLVGASLILRERNVPENEHQCAI